MSTVLLHALVWVPVALLVAVAMDLWAALLHGRVWHGSLWSIHRSHHEPQVAGATFERNDALSLLHAPIAIALILHGCRAEAGVSREVVFGGGIGMTLFGIAYLVFHDGLVHGRLPVRFLLRSGYVRSIVRAHHVHHAGTAGGAPFGFFLGRWELALAKRRRRAARPASGGKRRSPPASGAADERTSLGPVDGSFSG